MRSLTCVVLLIFSLIAVSPLNKRRQQSKCLKHTYRPGIDTISGHSTNCWPRTQSTKTSRGRFVVKDQHKSRTLCVS